MHFLTNFRELNEVSPAPFANSILSNLSDYADSRGWVVDTRDCKSAYEDVPFELIVGHDQSMYGDLTWGGLLNGKSADRMTRNLLRASKYPEYYIDELGPKCGIRLVSVEGLYFFKDGKHRLTIARFFQHYNPDAFKAPMVLSNVAVMHYKLDTELMEFYSCEAIIKKVKLLYPQFTFDANFNRSSDAKCLFVSSKTGSDEWGNIARLSLKEMRPFLENMLQGNFLHDPLPKPARPILERLLSILLLRGR